MSATLFLCEGIDLALELVMRSHAAWLADDLSTHDIVSLDSPQQQTHIVTCLSLTQRLLEHLNTCIGMPLGVSMYLLYRSGDSGTA